MGISMQLWIAFLWCLGCAGFGGFGLGFRLGWPSKNSPLRHVEKHRVSL